MRVLVVEDFEILARTIATGLRREGMAVDVVLDGDDALAHLDLTRYDVVVLDRDVPGVPGDDVCRHIVARHATSRVLMLTAASTVKDRVDGQDLTGGADLRLQHDGFEYVGGTDVLVFKLLRHTIFDSLEECVRVFEGVGQ